MSKVKALARPDYQRLHEAMAELDRTVCELVNTPAFAITVEKHRAVLRACETLNVAVTRVCFRFPVRPDAENKLNREEGGEG